MRGGRDGVRAFRAGMQGERVLRRIVCRGCGALHPWLEAWALEWAGGGGKGTGYKACSQPPRGTGVSPRWIPGAAVMVPMRIPTGGWTGEVKSSS